jgi:alpha-L-fucosidase
VDVSYSFQGYRNNSQIVLKAAGQSLYHSVHPTGQTVGEPNQDWHIDNFESNEIGTIDFPQPGFYTIGLSIQPTEADPIKFQWLWIN